MEISLHTFPSAVQKTSPPVEHSSPRQTPTDEDLEDDVLEEEGEKEEETGLLNDDALDGAED